MTPNEDWTDLSDAWTAPARDDQALADLARQVRRRSRLGRLNYIFEMVGCVLAAIMGGWVLATRPETHWLLGSGAVIFGLFAAAMTLWARGGPAPDDLDTPEQALDAAIRQAQAGRRWAQAGVAVCMGAAVFVGATAAGDTVKGPPVALYAGAAVFLLGCLAFYLRHQNRCTQRIEAHRAALDDLNGG